MHRKEFIRSASILAGVCLFSPQIYAMPSKVDTMSRIGMTTVVFRDRFNANSSNLLKLNEVPEYFKERFGISNIELWSKHFESTEKSYLDDIKRSLRKNKCNLINIQVDTSHDLSDPDQMKREKALEEMKGWIDIASYLGSEKVRASAMKKSFNEAVNSLKYLNSYCKKRGLVLLIENHFDLFSIPSNHTKVFNDISDENIGLLADFGNYKKDVDRYKALMEIAPNTKLVSSKVLNFDDDYNHISYDFARCVRIMESAGYKGVYSIEQWGAKKAYDYERVVDQVITEIKENI